MECRTGNICSRVGGACCRAPKRTSLQSHVRVAPLPSGDASTARGCCSRASPPTPSLSPNLHANKQFRVNDCTNKSWASRTALARHNPLEKVVAEQRIAPDESPAAAAPQVQPPHGAALAVGHQQGIARGGIQGQAAGLGPCSGEAAGAVLVALVAGAAEVGCRGTVRGGPSAARRSTACGCMRWVSARRSDATAQSGRHAIQRIVTLRSSSPAAGPPPPTCHVIVNVVPPDLVLSRHGNVNVPLLPAQIAEMFVRRGAGTAQSGNNLITKKQGQGASKGSAAATVKRQHAPVQHDIPGRVEQLRGAGGATAVIAAPDAAPHQRPDGLALQVHLSQRMPFGV